MNISVCITVLNEEADIGALLDSLLSQSKKPDEVVIVDGGSTDKTIEIINHYQKRFGEIKLLKEHSSRSRGRNLAVEMARNKVVAMTDAGCVCDKDWLKNISTPLETAYVDVAAGFYHMKAKNGFQKAETVFLGTLPKDFDIEFLPSTRSIAFTKEIWERVGGFPENLKGAAEDTVFNLKIVKNKAKMARVKSAVVEWGMPDILEEFFSKIYNYAKGDAKSKVWDFPGKGLTSHNIKSLFILFRYLAGIILLVLSFKYHLIPYFFILIFLYFVWSYRKILSAFGDYKIALWGPILQVTSDIGVILGFWDGILEKVG